MKLFHNNTCICESVEIADSFMKRFMGLMFRKELHNILFIKKCRSIHMCFMKFPIDAVFVDEYLKVVKIYNSIKPWHISGIHMNAAHVFECREGFAQMHGIAVNDQLSLQ